MVPHLRPIPFFLIAAVLSGYAVGQTGVDRNGIRRRHRYTAVHNATTGALLVCMVPHTAHHLWVAGPTQAKTDTPAAVDTAQAVLQGNPDIWLYGLVLANYDPVQLLEHFLSHYLETLGTHAPIRHENPPHGGVWRQVSVPSVCC